MANTKTWGRRCTLHSSGVRLQPPPPSLSSVSEDGPSLTEAEYRAAFDALARDHVPAPKAETGCGHREPPPSEYRAYWADRGDVVVSVEPTSRDLWWTANVHAQWGMSTLDWEQTLGAVVAQGETMTWRVEPEPVRALGRDRANVVVTLEGVDVDGQVVRRRRLQPRLVVLDDTEAEWMSPRQAKAQGVSRVEAIITSTRPPFIDELAGHTPRPDLLPIPPETVDGGAAVVP
jgi:hypothetical protein